MREFESNVLQWILINSDISTIVCKPSHAAEFKTTTNIKIIFLWTFMVEITWFFGKYTKFSPGSLKVCKLANTALTTRCSIHYEAQANSVRWRCFDRHRFYFRWSVQRRKLKDSLFFKSAPLNNKSVTVNFFIYFTVFDVFKNLKPTIQHHFPPRSIPKPKKP